MPSSTKIEKLKAGIRAKVKRAFSAIKRQFGFIKVRYYGRHLAPGTHRCGRLARC